MLAASEGASLRACLNLSNTHKIRAPCFEQTNGEDMHLEGPGSGLPLRRPCSGLLGTCRQPEGAALCWLPLNTPAGGAASAGRVDSPSCSGVGGPVGPFSSK